MSWNPYGVPHGWGAVSQHPVPRDQFELEKHLTEVPLHGTVVDIGAGLGLSLEAELQVLRPDLNVIAVEPGFNKIYNPPDPDEMSQILADTVSHFSPDDQTVLLDHSKWASGIVIGTADNLPVESSTADMVISYAAAPTHTGDYAQTLKECLRVLKVGGIALHGPMEVEELEEWDAEIRKSFMATPHKVRSFGSRIVTIVNAYGETIDAGFTHLQK